MHAPSKNHLETLLPTAAGTPGVLDEDALRRACNESSYRVLIPLALALTLWYVVITAVQAAGAANRYELIVAGVSGLTALFMLLIAHSVHHRRLPLHWANGVATGMALVALANNLLRMYVTADVMQTPLLVLPIVGAGLLIMSWPWLLVHATLSVSGWLLVTVLLPPSPHRLTHGLSVLAAVLLACIVHAVRRTQYRQTVALQQQREMRNRDLAAALEATEETRRHLEQSTAALERAMEEARQGEMRFRTLAEATAEGIVIYEDGRILDANPAVAAMFGYDFAELTRMPAIELVAPEARAQTLTYIERDRPDSCETIGLHQSGYSFPVEFVLRKIPYQGRVVHVAAIRDLTARRQAEQEILMLAHALRSISDCVSISSLDERFLFVNQTFLDTYGYEREEVVGQDLGLILAPGAERVGVEATSSAAGWHGELLSRRKNGEVFPVSMSTSVVRDERGEPIALVTMAKDITRQKAYEAALIQAKEQAEEGTRLKSAFLANMSHEIRTPMNGVIGMTSLLLDTEMTSEQREFVEVIRTSGDALLTIINDILDLSKIEAGQLELEVMPFDVRSCVEEALDLVVVSAADKGLELIYHVEQDVPAALDGDVTRLRQVLVNLISNAVKFTQEGEIFVNVGVQGHEADRYTLQFSIRDTGIGIPPERMDRLFKSFSQVDVSTTRRFGGTGLGLAISRKLCQLMGGDMWAESRVGTGSTFHFTVSGDAAASRRRVPAPLATASLEGKSLLIVDDNATNRYVLTLQAESWGLRPRAAASGTEALAWIDAGTPFDLAILDMQMPDMDGLMLGREIARRRPTLPLVMLSSIGTQLRDRAVPLAASLSKPVKPAQLLRVLLECLTPGERAPFAPAGTAAPEFDGAMAKRLPLRILLAEDNVVNQKVATRMLGRLGYRPDVVSNGQEVLDALRRRRYDVVLMDVQMPEMDGLEATRRLRQSVPANECPRIVALTAAAMDGNADSCFLAGMDDYISKPIRVEALVAALARCRPLHAAPAGAAAPGNGYTVNLHHLTALAGEDDPTFLTEILRDLVRDAAALHDAMGQALAARDAAALARHAHTLKSSAALIDAAALSERCAALEAAAADGIPADATGHLACIAEALQHVLPALQHRLDALERFVA